MQSSTLERRLTQEWQLLSALAAANPQRLTPPTADDLAFECTLLRTPVRGAEHDEHTVRIDFPPFFPAAPMEMHLTRPVLHPNIHPVTGFVCLWDTHRAANTSEHALLKLNEMLAGRLWNRRAEHLMQPDALPFYEHADDATAERAIAPLKAVTSVQLPPAPRPGVRQPGARRRLA